MAVTTAGLRTTGARPDLTRPGDSRRPVRVAIDGVEIVVVAVCGGIAVERTGDGAETRKESSRGNNSSNPLRKRSL